MPRVWYVIFGSVTITALKNQIILSFYCNEESSAAHLAVSSHLNLFYHEKDALFAEQLKMKQINQEEAEKKASFLQVTSKYQDAAQKGQSIKRSLESKKEAVKEWLHQKEKAIITSQNCLDVWENFRALILTFFDLIIDFYTVMMPVILFSTLYLLY